MEELNPQLLLDLVNKTMPYGKHKGTLFYQIPVNYLEWMNRQGFPKGNIGMLLATLYEIKLNGLEFLLEQIKRKQGLNN